MGYVLPARGRSQLSDGRGGLPARRAFVVVLDACGVGALPDAAEYGDQGTNTLGHLAQRLGGLTLPALGALGLGSILELDGIAPAVAPALHGRLHALGPGKDSTAGHWELMGVVAPSPDANLSERLPRRSRRPGPQGQRARRAVQPAEQRARGRRAVRVRAPEDRGADRLHQPGLGPADRRARRRRPDRRAVRDLRHGPGHAAARTRGRAGDRAPVHRVRRSTSSAPTPVATSPHRRPRAAISRPSSRPASRSTRSARSGSCSPGSGSTSSIPERRTPPRSSRRPS